MTFKKELTVLKKAQEDLSALNTVAKEELKGLEKQLRKYGTKPVWRELERILECEFNIKWLNYHGAGRDICGNKPGRPMTTAMQVFTNSISIFK
jgi:hypothetical protein